MNARPVLAVSAAVLATLAAWIATRRSRPQPARAPTTVIEAAGTTLSGTAVRIGPSLDAVDAAEVRDSVHEIETRPTPAAAQSKPAFGTLVGHLYDSHYRTLAKHKLSICNRRLASEAKSLFVITDRDGSFRFKQPIPAGDWWFHYEGDARIGTTVARPIRDEPTRVRPNETTSEEIVLINDRAIVGQIAFDETAQMSIVVLLASEFAPDAPLSELWVGNYPDQRTNGQFQIPAVEPGDYRLTYCLDTVDPAQRICVSETIRVGGEDLFLPPKPMSWATFGLAGVEVRPVEGQR